MATKKESAVVNIPDLRLEHFTLKIVGDSPLISHAWSEKAKLKSRYSETGGGIE